MRISKRKLPGWPYINWYGPVISQCDGLRRPLQVRAIVQILRLAPNLAVAAVFASGDRELPRIALEIAHGEL